MEIKLTVDASGSKQVAAVEIRTASPADYDSAKLVDRIRKLGV